MVSSMTLNRQKKLRILVAVHNRALELIMVDHQQRDKINMSHFKKIAREIEIMLNIVKEA